MSHGRWARFRQAGGAISTVLLVIGLAAAAYVAYRAYIFYNASVAPVVADVAKAGAEVAKVGTAISKLAGSLNPFRVTTDPAQVAAEFKSSFRIEPPAGYFGAFVIGIELLGQKHLQVVALIPQGVRPSDVFEGGRNEIRFNPGPHTIFLAAQSPRTDRDEMRDSIARLAGGDADTGPLSEVFIPVGGRKVAAYRGTSQVYGATNAIVYVFLDEGRLFFATGPKGAFDERALERALAALVAAHPANQLLYEHPKPPAIGAWRSDPCGIPGLADDFDVVVISVARGTTPLDVVIDRSSEEVRGEEVVVGATPRPVVLVLSGDQPIVWNVGRAPGARIAGVLAQGRLRQAVTGLPKSTRLSTYSTSDGPNACPHFRAERADARERAVFERRVKELFGRGIETFLTRKAGGRFVVGEASGEVAYSPDVSLQSVALPGNVLPGGQRGLDRLVKEKAIRPATEEEVMAWMKGAAQRTGQPLDAYRRKMSWRTDRDSVYVVLTEVDLPDGLYGANSRTFILPPGVPRPGGPRGHCTFLQMDQFQCYGTGCS